MPAFAIPTLHDQPKDFDYLFILAAQIVEVSASRRCNIELDFTGCRFLMQNAVAILGGLAKLIEHNGCSVTFRWDTLNEKVRRSLERNGFLNFFGQPSSIPTGKRKPRNVVPFRQDLVADESAIIRYLYQNWIGSGHVHLSPLLTDHIVAKMWEIYANAFDHADSPVGIFSCGQYYPQRHLLKLTVVDFGAGIPFRVRQHLGKRMNAADALQWAFQRGNSTKSDPEGIPRGLGLDLLREFVKLNRGKLEVFSYDGFARIDRMQNFGARHPSFVGTVVNITFSCDESYYRLASELVSTQLF